MPRLPSRLTYNDLNGREATEALCDWFRQLLSTHPQLQPHLTLPNAKIALSVEVAIDMYVGGTVPVASPPEHVSLSGNVTMDNDVAPAGLGLTAGLTAARTTQGAVRASAPDAVLYEHTETGVYEHTPQSFDKEVTRISEERFSHVINAAPVAGGKPPDEIREQHELPIPRPGYGPRDTGSHLFLADVIDATERKREGIVDPSYRFADESPIQITEQVIPIADGSIDIDLSGAGRMRQGDTVVTGPVHRASEKKFGDARGSKYGSVAATYDLGPAGLDRPGGGSRPKLGFGNNR